MQPPTLEVKQHCNGERDETKKGVFANIRYEDGVGSARQLREEVALLLTATPSVMFAASLAAEPASPPAVRETTRAAMLQQQDRSWRQFEQRISCRVGTSVT